VSFDTFVTIAAIGFAFGVLNGLVIDHFSKLCGACLCIAARLQILSGRFLTVATQLIHKLQ
jgi:hypothetical protein